jgi:hypothetical protein
VLRLAALTREKKRATPEGFISALHNSVNAKPSSRTEIQLLTVLGPIRGIVGGVHGRIPSADEVSRREVLLDKRTYICDHADVPLVFVEGLVSNDVRCLVISYNEPPAVYGIFNDVGGAVARVTVYPDQAINPVVYQHDVINVEDAKVSTDGASDNGARTFIRDA